MAMGDDLNEKLLQNQTDFEENAEEEEPLGKRVWEESKKMWVVAGSAIFSRFSTFGITLISQAFIGHIGATELAGYAVVMTVLVRFSLGVLLGMASALETLCGQAYGAKQYSMLGVYLQRSWIVLFLASLFLVPFFLFGTPLLEALGQEEQIAKVAGGISLWSIGLTYAFLVSFTCQMFLQAQSKNSIIAYLAAVSMGIHLLVIWLWTVKFKFGLNGAMASTFLAFWIPNLGQLLFIMLKCPDTWTGFSFLAFKDLWPVVKLSLSSGVMVCLETWYYTILILLIGNMKGAEVSLNALSICLNINGMGMMIALGFYAAASVRVSNELGRGSSRGAKFAIVITVLTSLAIGVVFFFVFLLIRKRVSYIFTSDPNVAEAVDDLSSLLAFSMLLNSVQPVLSGVSIGAGWQSIVAYVNIGCYYLIGIPLGVVIGIFLDLHFKGVWIGMVFGTFVQTIVLIIITCKTNWDEQVEKARKRIDKWAVVDSQESNNSNGPNI
ncbi:hypothetical protein RIF29_19630 [Crotalaria pallida]|uniref:Protein DETOXIFICATION n=1 Tax=Crotalaria pallida TaxID=3830 RepID=A0AAN9F3Z1_CROPI